MTPSKYLRRTITDVVRGKSVARWMTNFRLAGTSIHGMVLDLGSGKERASHFRYLVLGPGTTIVTADINRSSQPDHLMDLEKDPIPYSDDTFAAILCFNLLEHIYNPANMLRECLRTLLPGGQLIGSVPFLVRVHPDPHDFHRLTGEALHVLLSEHGFEAVAISSVGTGPFLASYSQVEPAIPPILRPFAILPNLVADKVVRILRRKADHGVLYPLTYLFTATKATLQPPPPWPPNNSMEPTRPAAANWV